MPRIIIPCSLRRFTNNQSVFEAKSENLAGAIQELTHSFHDLQQYLFEPCGKFRSFIRIFVGNREVNDLDPNLTSVKEREVISIIPAIAGG